jgi:hypothetical protein
MSRRIAVVLLCAAVMLVVVESIDAAPAPLPKRTKEETLLQRLRKKMHDRGYYLHEMRPAPEPEECILVLSRLGSRNPESKTSGFFTMPPIPLQRLTNSLSDDKVADLLELQMELAQLEDLVPMQPMQVRPLLRVRGGGLNDRK